MVDLEKMFHSAHRTKHTITELEKDVSFKVRKTAKNIPDKTDRVSPMKVTGRLTIIHLFSIISELKSEFPAIWLVEQFVLWRYVHHATQWIWLSTFCFQKQSGCEPVCPSFQRGNIQNENKCRTSPKVRRMKQNMVLIKLFKGKPAFCFELSYFIFNYLF